MTKGLIGKKIGMTQIFDEAGKVVPVTVIEAGPCVVTQLKTAENDGYEAVQLGFGDLSPKHVNKPMTGHFKKNDLPFKRTLKEFRLDDISNVNVGDVLKADVFAAGDVIDVSGVSMGAENVTVQNLVIVKIDAENNLIAIKGAIPGPKGGVVCITDAVKKA